MLTASSTVSDLTGHNVQSKVGINRQEMRLNPASEIARLHQFGNVFWSDLNMRWIVLGQAEGLEVLRQETFCLPNYGPLVLNLAQRLDIDLSHLYGISQFIPFLHNGPRHEKTRNVITRLTAQLQPAYIEHLPKAASELLVKWSDGQPFDFSTDFADQLHVHTLARVIGLDPSDLIGLTAKLNAEELNFNNSVMEFVSVNSNIEFVFNELSRLTKSHTALRLYMEKIGKTLESYDLETDFNSQIYCLAAIFILGKDTISGALSLSLKQLLEENGNVINPKEILQGAHFPREMLRISAPVNLVEREASLPCSIGAHQIAQGDRILIVIRAINTDPSVYACPHKASESLLEHFSFGTGIHACVGRNIATQAVNATFAKLSEFRVLHQTDIPTMGKGRNTRKVESLKIRIEMSDHEN